ncbi:MAG: hypothetical protein PVG08_16605, partial [Desulfobacterales bacterium]
NGWWEWLSATITRVFAVKNRSHNPKTADTKLKVSSKIRLDARGQRRCLYETSYCRKSEPQNLEYRTAEFRRVVSLRSVLL